MSDSTSLQPPLRILPTSSQPISVEQTQLHLQAFLDGFKERRSGDMEVGLVERLIASRTQTHPESIRKDISIRS
ncbi:hypothetical protein BDY24DRAFT_413258 [Mrakia frigida]|uniref:uncharacterized protein n=1 Tax=Mrakia frigida TaxID=29902 RepID=UPI003FCC12C6